MAVRPAGASAGRAGPQLFPLALKMPKLEGTIRTGNGRERPSWLVTVISALPDGREAGKQRFDALRRGREDPDRELLPLRFQVHPRSTFEPEALDGNARSRSEPSAGQRGRNMARSVEDPLLVDRRRLRVQPSRE